MSSLVSTQPTLRPSPLDGFGGLSASRRVSVPASLCIGQLRSRLRGFLMQGAVLLLRQRDKIARIVVLSVAVDVVHILVRIQSAAIRLLPDETMLGNVSADVREVVIGQPHQYVALAGNLATSLPSVGALPSRVVPANKADRMTFDVSKFSTRVFRDGRALSAPAFADTTRRYKVRGDALPGHLFPGKAIGSSAREMPAHESRWAMAVVPGRRNRLPATALTDAFHVRNIRSAL